MGPAHFTPNGISLGLSRISELLSAALPSPQPFHAVHVAGTNGKGSICTYLCALLAHPSTVAHLPRPRFGQTGGSAGEGGSNAVAGADQYEYAVGRFTSPHLLTPRDAISFYAWPSSTSSLSSPPSPLPPSPRPIACPQHLYASCRSHIQSLGSTLGIEPTSFEVQTATAFLAFALARVRVAVVEVGVGGTLDATNALPYKDVAVVGAVGLDHERLLGASTVEDIAAHKAGIIVADAMNGGVKGIVVDGGNDESVVRVVKETAQGVEGARVVDTVRDGLLKELQDAQASMAAAERGGSLHQKSPSASPSTADLAPHQLRNLACALAAFRLLVPSAPLAGKTGTLPSTSAIHDVLAVARKVQWPGRLHWVSPSAVSGIRPNRHQQQVSSDAGLFTSRHGPNRHQQEISSDAGLLASRRTPILLDGAHNAQSAAALCAYVDAHLRQPTHASTAAESAAPVTWLLSLSNGRDAHGLLSHLGVRRGDHVVATRFATPVEDMPWVVPVGVEEITSAARRLGASATAVTGEGDNAGAAADSAGDVPRALARAAEPAGCDGPLVVAGSLYLVSDVIRYLKSVGMYDDGDDVISG